MKLKELKLENFQGFREKTFTFDSIVNEFRGSNGTGKTTLANSFVWLLFGKPSTGETNWSPKTTDLNATAVAGAQTAVTGIFEHKGDSIELRRVFKEKWSTARGTKESVFKGHETSYYINDVPKKEREYNDFIKDLTGGEVIAKCLMFPTFFSSDSVSDKWNWQTRRKVVMDVVGGVSYQDVINSNDDLKELEYHLVNDSVEDTLVAAKEKKRKLDKDLKELPARIDEVRKSIVELMPIEEIDKHIDNWRNQEKLLNEQLKELDVSSVSAETTMIIKELQELELTIQEYIREFDMNNFEKRKSSDSKKNILLNELQDLDRKMNELSYQLSKDKRNLESYTREREELIAEWKKVNTSVAQEYPEFDTATTYCPLCGREYESFKVEEIKENYESNKKEHYESFNLNKAKKLEEINKKGFIAKDTIAKLEDSINKKYDSISNIEREQERIRKEVDSIIVPVLPNINDDSKYIDMIMKKQEIEKRYEVSKTKDRNDSHWKIDKRNKICIELDSIENEKKLLQMERAKHEFNQSQRRRIDELKGTQKYLATQLEEAEYTIWMCNLYQKTYCEMVVHIAKEKFNGIDFKMFEDNISNAGIKELCDVLVPTPNGLKNYRDANNASRINGGLMIIDALSKYYGIELPVLVDNAESVVQLMNIDNQQLIQLHVDSSYKTLAKVSERMMNNVSL